MSRFARPILTIMAVIAVSLGWSYFSNSNSAIAMQEGDQGFALIELFTSEGCSSCPSADDNLARIAKEANENGVPVYTLSYHVDYWNDLGWRDPYSDKVFTNRQREYASDFGSSRIYTPQMVVNGVAEFVGSNQDLSNRAVKLALRGNTDTQLVVSSAINRQQVEVAWQVDQLPQGEVLNIALVQNSGEQQVTRGENARRRLQHVNIVRKLQTIQTPKQRGSIKLDLPQDFEQDGFHVVAFVQSSKDRTVHAAARSQIADSF